MSFKVRNPPKILKIWLFPQKSDFFLTILTKKKTFEGSLILRGEKTDFVAKKSEFWVLKSDF